MLNIRKIKRNKFSLMWLNKNIYIEGEMKMEYINTKEFSKQSAEIQKVFLDWWKPSLGDLYARQNIKVFPHCVWKYDHDLILNISSDVWEYKSKCIPLLTEGQLGQFVEDKTGFTMSCRYEEYENIFISDTYYIVLYNIKTHKVENTYEYETDKRIDAYWRVALEIINKEFITK
jgi:hypothetical protein